MEEEKIILRAMTNEDMFNLILQEIADMKALLLEKKK